MKIKSDYSFIRGVCHNPDPSKSEKQLHRELSCAKRLQINSIRFWILQDEWEKDSKAYIELVKSFIHTCFKYNLSVMPIIWNGNFIVDFQEPTEYEWKVKEEYAKDIIHNFAEEPNLLMWDIINEPMCNDYIRKSPKKERGERFDNLTAYIRRLCHIVRNFDEKTPITVGHEQVEHCVSTVDLVDVISFHEYQSTRAGVENTYLRAEKLAKQYGNKLLLNTETGCIGRANPYDIELEFCERYHIGWYLFCLVSEGFWGDIHGLIYPDGTIRDPAIIAALFGFYRNKTSKRILPNPNKEGHAYNAIKAVEDVLRVEETTLFMSKIRTADDVLEAAEYCVNILEACEFVPMYNPPSAQIASWRSQPDREKDIFAIKRFAYNMAKLLKECCLIL